MIRFGSDESSSEVTYTGNTAANVTHLQGSFGPSCAYDVEVELNHNG